MRLSRWHDMDDNALDKVIMSCIAAGVGAILVCSFVIPVFANMLGTLTTGEGGNYSEAMASDIDLWSTMLSLVVLMVIVGFLIAIVRNATNKGR